MKNLNLKRKTLRQQLADRHEEIESLKKRLLVVETENDVRAAVIRDHFRVIAEVVNAGVSLAHNTVPVLPPISAFSTEPSFAVREFIKAGQFINAVKQRRAETNEGLRESKIFCDAVRDAMVQSGEMAR